MRVEVLLSTMNQENTDIVRKCHINSDVLIINQCDKEGIVEIETNDCSIRMISTIQRGLSNSRNMALDNAKGDICILCDDDIEYISEYESIVKQAFRELPDADLIVFNINRKYSKKGNNRQEKRFKRIRKIPFYKTYGSVHVAFKLESVRSHNIKFNTDFGTGSGMYEMAEDALFFSSARKAGFHCYEYPACFANLYVDGSSWFNGFNEKFFYDVGAYLSVAYPIMKHLFKWYYPIKLRSRSELSEYRIIKSINMGIKGYKKRLNYKEYKKHREA